MPCFFKWLKSKKNAQNRPESVQLGVVLGVSAFQSNNSSSGSTTEDKKYSQNLKGAD